jgi:shikimate dehydrogenase
MRRAWRSSEFGSSFMVDGNTTLIAHIGYPTGIFKSPMIYNPYFCSIGLNAAVIPMGIKREDYESSFRPIFRMTNVMGGLITMPHKISTVPLLDEVSPAVMIAGSCNAVLKREDGALVGDVFDGEGFVRGVLRKGKSFRGKSALIVGCGGVGSAIAAALAAAGAVRMGLFDLDLVAMEGLARRLQCAYSALDIQLGSNNPEGYDFALNATPMGLNADDPMPMDVARLSPETFVGEAVMREEVTAFLAAARMRGCETQIGVDMLYEQIPAYLEFFGFPTTTPENLRALVRA